jgi:hypothetical protein
MRRTVPIFLLAAGFLVSGCGSSNSKEQPGPAPNVLPHAGTADEWARRVVDRLLRPLNQDLVVLQNFNSPQVRVYIASQNTQTLRIIDRRLRDLKGCSTKLAVIGPPPAGAGALSRVNDHLRKACRAYEEVATSLLRATDLLSSGNADDAARGEDAVQSVRDPSARAAKELSAGVKIAQKLRPFRRAGLQPSV